MIVYSNLNYGCVGVRFIRGLLHGLNGGYYSQYKIQPERMPLCSLVVIHIVQSRFQDASNEQFAGGMIVKKLSILCILSLILFILSPAYAADTGNTWNDSFNKAKKTLEREIYRDNRTTFYCGCPFDEYKKVQPCQDYIPVKGGMRSSRVEWEHIGTRCSLRAVIQGMARRRSSMCGQQG